MRDEWLSDRARAAEASVPGGFDLSLCVRERIHRLGGVQSYGTLLAVDPGTGVVDTAAENTRALLGAAAGDLVGGPVGAVLAEEDWAEALESAAEGDAVAVTFPVTAGAAGHRAGFDLSVHRREGLVVLEFEPRDAGEEFRFAGFYQGVRRALRRLRSAGTVLECCRTAVGEVRRLTGFDRVVAYRFDGLDGPGEVVAEDVDGDWEPWLGLWFPATDVPPQARRLYEENWIRVICDVDDPTAGLFPALRPATGEPLDLSGAALRTVSGFHLEYLRNIGVGSSMSVSLLREGRLWGLIACHGAGPTWLPPEVRSACELFGAAFSMQLAAIEERERADALERSGRDAAAVAELLDADVDASLMRHHEAVRDLVGADGVLLVRGDRVSSAGTPVPADTARLLSRYAAAAAPGSVWATDRLPEVLAGYGGEGGRVPEGADGPGADVQGADTQGSEAQGTEAQGTDTRGPDARDPGAGAAPSPAGVLLLPLSDAGDYLAWVRAERAVPREWAADPARPVLVGLRGERLTPRGSGAVFRSMIRGRSLPWTAREQAAALEMRRLLTGLVLRHADELGVLNAELRMTNLDLDSFAHVAAHDLKEPLRGIANAATFTLEDAGDGLDATSVRRLETMQRLAARMDDLLNSLLHYARMGRTGLRRTDVALDDVLDAALEVAGPRLAEERVRVLRPAALPRVHADSDRLYEILLNLLVNAAKYAADRPDRTVEVTVTDAVPPGAETPVPAVVVRDNGIGIPYERQGEVFDLFRRLHGPSERGGGTGVGLAVVKRIVERHGGSLWLTGGPGTGTAFYFTLGEEPPPGDAPPGGTPSGDGA
ncbi:GAF domain-containing protein [Streptomyces sp. J2-1]|uniref:ATP-binding protein n=1 Tax=Streptomyces corallincola TaxID=2851888 RepID=UPI001C389CE8|nr:ATP-binding protein [Streptomyces corallincola]MBV2357059.1 GAF domain-containing protein [Streptomyces corallincola]